MSWRRVTASIPTSSRFAGFPRYQHPRGLSACLSESLIFHAVSPQVILVGWSGWLHEFLFSIPSCWLAQGCVILLSVLKRMRRMCFMTIKKLTRLWLCRSVGGFYPSGVYGDHSLNWKANDITLKEFVSALLSS